MGIYSIADWRFRIAEWLTDCSSRFRVREAQKERRTLLKQIGIVSCAVNDPMDKDCLRAHGIENKIIVNDKIAVSKPGEFLLSRNFTESGMVREPRKPGFDLVGKLFGGSGVVLRDERDDLYKIVFRDAKEFDRKLMRAHEAFS